VARALAVLDDLASPATRESSPPPRSRREEGAVTEKNAHTREDPVAAQGDMPRSRTRGEAGEDHVVRAENGAGRTVE